MNGLSWHSARLRRLLAIAPPFLWLGLFLLLPFLLVLKISFSDLRFGIPPYTPLAEIKEQTLTLALSLRGYALLFSDSLYIATYLNSVKMAAITTLRSEEHTSELQSLLRISYAGFCLKKQK